MTTAGTEAHRYDLDERFNYHAPLNDAVVDAHARAREACRVAAGIIDELVPDGREKSLAITKLEEAMMWANAGIARNHQDGRFH